MNELKVFENEFNGVNIWTNQSGNILVSSREVARNFGKEHKHILRAIQEKIEVSPKLGSPQYFIETTYVDKSNRQSKEYLLTRDGFSFLVMGFTGAKADEWKLKYIEAFNAMENVLRNQNQIVVPRNYKEAVEHLLVQINENERLLEENKKLEHKAEYYNVFVNRKLNLSFRDTAKELMVGERWLIEYLMNKGYIYRDKRNELKPYAQYIKSNLFALREYYHNGIVGTQTLITPKGRLKILSMFKEDNVELNGRSA